MKVIVLASFIFAVQWLGCFWQTQNYGTPIEVVKAFYHAIDAKDSIQLTATFSEKNNEMRKELIAAGGFKKFFREDTFHVNFTNIINITYGTSDSANVAISEDILDVKDSILRKNLS